MLVRRYRVRSHGHMGLFLDNILNSGKLISSNFLKTFYEISLISQNSQISVRNESFLQNFVDSPMHAGLFSVGNFEISSLLL
jgi:hypothetical protein